MDRSLDEILAEKQSNDSSRASSRRGGKGRRDRSDNFPRDGVRKSYRDERRNLDRDWVHDRFEDNGPRSSNNRRRRNSPEIYKEPQGTKLRVENIHYELTEEDLDELFNRIGPVLKVELRYDRAGRSEGTAFIVYESRDDAREAIKQFDGANANGQPIRIVMMPSGPAPRARNPFDTAVMPGKPLEERITKTHTRSVSPDRDVDEAAKKGIDRYVPGSSSRTRSPLPPRRREGRRPGARRDGGTSGDRSGGSRGGGGGGSGGAGGGRKGNPRPKKTAEELDAEMADYFGGPGESKPEESAPSAAPPTAAPTAAEGPQDDIDMIE